MNDPEEKLVRRPVWFTLLCVLLCVPNLFMPLLSGMDALREALGVLYTYIPLYVSVSVFCAWYSYERRREVAWILIGVVLLAYLAMYLLYRSYGV
ncbi:MAG: hypothetical protein K2M06_02775 [Muribaculaceae bacterium]|nr:hypothetical protein [Muribaculaceae bacterium]